MQLKVLAKQEVSKILEAIHRKSKESDIEFDVLFEVFKRGYMTGKDKYNHLVPQEIGFNRVNSWLAGGLARRLDADLCEEMGSNTPADDMVCDHDEPTPGEKLKSKLRKKKK